VVAAAGALLATVVAPEAAGKVAPAAAAPPRAPGPRATPTPDTSTAAAPVFAPATGSERPLRAPGAAGSVMPAGAVGSSDSVPCRLMGADVAVSRVLGFPAASDAPAAAASAARGPFVLPTGEGGTIASTLARVEPMTAAP